MLNNFSGLTPMEKEIDSAKAEKFFNEAKNIVKASKKNSKTGSRDEIYALIEEITNYYQFHSTTYRSQLLLLQDFLSKCIESLVNNNNDGFVQLEVFLKTKNDFVRKGWLS